MFEKIDEQRKRLLAVIIREQGIPADISMLMATSLWNKVGFIMKWEPGQDPVMPDGSTIADAVKELRAGEYGVYFDKPSSAGTGGAAVGDVLNYNQALEKVIRDHGYSREEFEKLGMSLLLQSVLTIAEGTHVGAHVEKGNEDETRKAVTSALHASASFIWIDNINNFIKGSTIPHLVTCKVWTDRLLGRSEEVHIPVTCTVILSGNNMRMTKEIARRGVPIFLNAKRPPTERGGFTHNLEEWIPENRPELVAACLTIIRYWINQGEKEWEGDPLPSFTSYSRIMGGVLEAMGVDGFLQNLNITAEASDSDDSNIAHLGFEWYQEYGDTPRPVGSPYGGSESGEWDGDKSIVTLIEKKGVQLDVSDGSDSAKAAWVGKVLVRHRDVVLTYTGKNMQGQEETLTFCFKSEAARSHKNNWWVELVEFDPLLLAAEAMIKAAPEKTWGVNDDKDNILGPREGILKKWGLPKVA